MPSSILSTDYRKINTARKILLSAEILINKKLNLVFIILLYADRLIAVHLEASIDDAIELFFVEPDFSVKAAAS